MPTVRRISSKGPQPRPGVQHAGQSRDQDERQGSCEVLHHEPANGDAPRSVAIKCVPAGAGNTTVLATESARPKDVARAGGPALKARDAHSQKRRTTSGRGRRDRDCLTDRDPSARMPADAEHQQGYAISARSEAIA